MNKSIISNSKWAMPAVAALLLFTGAAGAQDVQVRNEVVVSGSTAADETVDGVIVPDLTDDIAGVAYTYWVSPAGGRNFQTPEFLPRGGLLVRDDSILREFLPNGDEKISKAFPIDCTKLRFDSPKGQGLQDTYLGSCTASLVREDNSMRICGPVKGQGLKCIAYDLDLPGGDCAAATLPTTLADAEARECEAVRTTAEPPPQLTDAIADDSDFVEFRWPDGEPRLLLAGDRKSLYAIAPASRPFALDAEDAIETLYTFNGRKINAFTTLRDSLVVSFDDGEMRKLNLLTLTDEFFFQHTLCGGNKTPQGFAMRSDPDETLVFALNRACGTLTALDADGNVVDTDGDLTAMPFVFDNSGTGVAEFLGKGVAARAGETGTFADCEVGETCELGQLDGQATQSNTTLVEQEDYDPAYRMFQSYISDCRWTLERPCPIVNCPEADDEVFYSAPGSVADPVHEASCPAKELQVLDLTQATIRAETSGALANLLPDPPPVVTIPGYLRGDESFPGLVPGERVDNNYEFYSLWAISDVVITDTFDLVLDVDRFRVDAFGNSISNDPSDVILAADATAEERLAEVADRSNAVIHNRETYNSVARTFPSSLGTFTSDKPGVLIDVDFGSKRAGGITWSAVTTGLQTYYDSAMGYLDLAKMQLFELQAHKDQFLCAPFVDPDGNWQGPTLSSADCDLLQGHMEQIKDKSAVCHEALLKPQQGASRENCNALFTKIDNALAALENSVTPPPLTDIALIAPNYLGEFEVRLRAYRFTTEEWLLPATPTDGIPLEAP